LAAPRAHGRIAVFIAVESGRMPRFYVALDIETTGLDPREDAIIEVGAIRFTDSGPANSFASLVNPGRPVPAKIVHLTGIDTRALQSAPPVWEVARRLDRFVGDDTIVGHSIGFDLAFLERHSVLAGNRKIDTFELSTILLPHVDRHSLQHLTSALALGSDGEHRALADSEAAMRLFLALREAALSLPASLLEQVVSLGRRSGWEQSVFFEDALREQLQRPSGTSIGQQLFAKGVLHEQRSLLHGVGDDDTLAVEPIDPPLRLDVTALCARLQPGGQLASSLAAYEHRPQQVDMARAVATAFNDGHHLVAEAGTGVGKSLAYLLPAMQYAGLNNDRVVISSHTINLQEQLYGKDIPQVAGTLATPVRVAILKGRGNYVCPVRLRSQANRPTMSADQALGLAKVIVWLPSTATGDRSELFLNTPTERQLWQQVCSDDAWCHGERCGERHRGNCFFSRARSGATKAHVVIVNHALLTTDAAAESRAIPEYNHLIVDEAHQLEGACTRALRLELALGALREALRGIVSWEKGTIGGPLPAIQHGLSRRQNVESRLGQDIGSLTDLIGGMLTAVDGLASALDSCAAVLLPRHRSGERAGSEQRRITERERGGDEWHGLVSAWEPISRQGRRAVTLAQEVVRGAQAGGSDTALTEQTQALVVAGRLLLAQVDALDEVIASPKPDNVYWLSTQEPAGVVVLNRAPVSVGEFLGKSLFSAKRTVVLTSATLATDGAFDYFASQVGLDNYRSVSVGSPFDYRHSTLVSVATDIPEPRNPGHQQAIERALLELAKALGGRLMALFTSNSQLRLTTRGLQRLLEQEGILLYSQSDGTSRNALLDGFKSADRAVLLGTRSFWEGVDVPGDALQCLAMVKLPFMVPDDPLVAARSERFTDSFDGYLLPEAILTFRQGFGRLIRTKTDRGVFVLLDSRVRTKGYGQRFLRALPDCTFYDGPIATIPERAAWWLRREESR